MITFIVPIYNGERYLEACIQSVLNQDLPCWELLLIDDGSIDSTPLICEKYVTLNERIHYYRQANAGVQKARWKGIENATNAYVSFLDADDVIAPSFVRQTIEQLQSNVDILVMGRFDFPLSEWKGL
jgi:glycosyltransferase involved in cell wall biosynthesis